MVDSAISGGTPHSAIASGARRLADRARTARRVSGRLRCALLGFLLVTAAASAQAQPAVKQVLVLQSFDRGILVLDHFTGNFRVSLDQRAGKPVNVVQVVVGPTGFVGAPEQAVVDYIRSIFADRPPPDLIVTVAGPAAVFARKHRRQLFPGTPLLFASVDQRWLRDAPLGENETAVAVVNDFPRLIDDILRVLPETRQVFMVIGSGTLGQFWRRELESEFARFRDRVTFVWSDELSLPDILRRCASLPSHSAIFYLTFGTDAQGGAYADEQVLADLHATANAPLFGALSPLLGHGIVGGTHDVHRRPCSQHSRRGQSNLEGRATWKPQSPATIAGSTDIRLARAAAVGHPRESAAAWQRREVSPPEPVGANTELAVLTRDRRADFPIAPDRVAPVRAPRTAARRDRKPAEPGSRRRRQSPRDDVGADHLDRT